MIIKGHSAFFCLKSGKTAGKGLLKDKQNDKVNLYVQKSAGKTGVQTRAGEAPSAGKGNEEDGLHEVAQAHEPYERCHAGAAATGAAV